MHKRKFIKTRLQQLLFVKTSETSHLFFQDFGMLLSAVQLRTKASLAGVMAILQIHRFTFTYTVYASLTEEHKKQNSVLLNKYCSIH